MTTLITGAGGQLGRLVVASLLERGVPADQILAGARRPESVADLGVPTVEFDYDRPDTLVRGVEGVDTVLLISASAPSGRIAQHTAVVQAAAAAGVGRLVYTSVTRASTTDLFIAPDHKATEEAIAASGIPATILRNDWYHENQLPGLRQAIATGVLLSSAGDGRIASAARADYAEAASIVLTTPGHEGAVYELSGDRPWTADDFAAAASEVSGRPITVEHLTRDEHAEALAAAGLDQGTIGFVVTLDQDVRAGALDDDRDDLSRLLGRPTTPLTDWMRSAV
jgi:NAD(P)H dehydrogenase (quinone)